MLTLVFEEIVTVSRKAALKFNSEKLMGCKGCTIKLMGVSLLSHI